MLSLCGLLSVATSFGILYMLFAETFAFFREVSLAKFFLDTQWTPLFVDKHFGIWALISGTLMTSVIAMAVAIPLGLLSAIYLSEFASKKTRNILKPALELLAGIPTVVFGYFALTFLTPLIQKVIPGLSHFNSVGTGIVMGVMIMPIIASLSEDAIFSVPNSLREGSLALGANRIKTIFKVVLPAAFSGIGASIILGVSRAIGETMIVAIAAGQQPKFTFDPRVAVETMTAYIVQVSLGDTPANSLAYKTIFAVATCLFLFTFSLNVIALRLKRKLLRGAH